MSNPLIALIPAMIWAFSPIYYRIFMKKLDFLALNFFRTSVCSAALALPAIYLGFGHGTDYALVSGFVTLALGDTLFLLAIREVGASIAAPVVYTYVLFVQLTATLIGEAVPLVNFVGAFMVILGVYVLSRGGEGKPRAKGIVLALVAGIAWTVGQDLVGVAMSAGGNVVSVTFARNLAGAVALGIAVFATRRHGWWPGSLSRRELAFLTFIAITDLAVGSLLLVYSIAVSGVALTVIVTSISPFLTQVLSKAMGKESPSGTDFAGGALIVAALVIVVLF